MHSRSHRSSAAVLSVTLFALPAIGSTAPRHAHQPAEAWPTLEARSAHADGQHQHGATPDKTPAGQTRWMKPAPSGPLPPMPYEGYPAPRPLSVVHAVYEFAARHPEVMNYMPCFCGCERSAGHIGNHDCFVRRRDAQGRMVEWNPHGYGCAICIDVGRDAMQMFNAGASVSSIRTAVEAKYKSRFPTMTPTPKPVAVAKK